MDIYSTYYMGQVIKEKPTLYTFMRDRYFGGEPLLFQTEEVIVDYDDGEGNLIAPFVIPRIGAVPVMRRGYETRRLTPAYIAPSRPLSIDDLTRRLAGESLVSTMTPEQRERQYLIGDIDTLDQMITRREEWMCAQTMLDNACTMTHIGNNGEKGIDLTVRYYTGSDNPGVFKPSGKWEVGTEIKWGNWYTDIVGKVKDMTAKGRTVTDLVVGTEVAELIMNDPWVLKLLDNRRIEIGEIDPRWQPSGVTVIGRLNFGGVPLTIFCYEGSYEERTIGKKGEINTETKWYFPKKGALLAAPNTGKLRYGAVTQVEMDNQTHTRTGTRIPKHLVKPDGNQKETILTSRPIAAPVIKNPWRACRDVFSV